MKARNWIATLAALGTTMVVASQASALNCYAPALTFIDNIIPASSNNPAYLDCDSRNAAGVQVRARAKASANPSTKRLTVTLVLGDYARAGAYNSNRQGTGCFVEDFSASTASGSGVGVTCAQTFAFYDMETDNN